jgi:hypothetical protein
MENPNTQPNLTQSAEDRLNNCQTRINELLKQSPVKIEDVKILKAERARIEKEMQKAAHTSLSDDEEREAVGAIKADIREWLKVRKFNYVLANDRYWLDKDTHWIPVSAQTLLRERPTLSSGIERELLTKVMREDNRFFDECTYSYDKVPSDTLNMMRKDFAPIVEEGEAHWIFDCVIRSVAGGKAANISHVEQLILTKYLHPESTVVPSLVFNDGGSTGKGVLVSNILTAIFGRFGVADNLSIDKVTGQFNAMLQGRAIWYINETSHGTYSHNKLKQIVGSPTMWIEPKGINAFEVPMTAWLVISGNGVDGSVLLEGNGTDRRWSIISGNKSLPEHIADAVGTTDAEALAWLRKEGLAILSDRTQAGRWLAALVARHGDVNVSEGHHEEDYASIRDLQRTLHDDMFHQTFGHEDFACIRTIELFQAYLDECASLKRKPTGRNKFHQMARNYLEKHFPDYAGRIAFNIEIEKTGRTSKVEYYSRNVKPSDAELAHNGRDVLRSLGFGWIPRAD